MNRHHLRIDAWLVRQAARRAPQDLSARLQEEWLADLAYQHGAAARLYFALGCLWAAVAICNEHVAAASTVTAASTALVAPRIIAVSAYRRSRLSHPIQAETSEAIAGALCEINITPLIDVMLVLLITLIFSVPIMTHASKIQMPSASTLLQALPPEVIDLDVDFDGAVTWNGMTIHSFEQLETRFQNAAASNPQPEIHLRPDPHVKYDYVARILASAQRNGMTKLLFANTGRFEE
jgi:biopolymer transport protein ExbD